MNGKARWNIKEQSMVDVTNSKTLKMAEQVGRVVVRKKAYVMLDFIRGKDIEHFIKHW